MLWGIILMMPFYMYTEALFAKCILWSEFAHWSHLGDCWCPILLVSMTANLRASDLGKERLREYHDYLLIKADRAIDRRWQTRALILSHQSRINVAILCEPLLNILCFSWIAETNEIKMSTTKRLLKAIGWSLKAYPPLFNRLNVSHLFSILVSSKRAARWYWPRKS